MQRHLANILTKLDQTARTGAATYAMQACSDPPVAMRQEQTVVQVLSAVVRGLVRVRLSGAKDRTFKAVRPNQGTPTGVGAVSPNPRESWFMAPDGDSTPARS